MSQTPRRNVPVGTKSSLTMLPSFFDLRGWRRKEPETGQSHFSINAIAPLVDYEDTGKDDAPNTEAFRQDSSCSGSVTHQNAGQSNEAETDQWSAFVSDNAKIV